MVNDQVGNNSNNIGITAIDPKSVLVENSANSINGTSTTQQPPTEVYNHRVSNSPPLAVLPLNPSAKLDQEPNPFEQSFSSVSKSTPPPSSSSSSNNNNNEHSSINETLKPSTNSTTANNNSNASDTLKLPPVAAMTSPSAPAVMSSVPKDIANQYTWDSLRAGPLSPSMLQRPANPDDFVYSGINPTSSILSYPEIAPSNSYQVKNEPYYVSGRTATSPTTKYQDKQSIITTTAITTNKSSHSNSVTQTNNMSRRSISSTTSTTSTTSNNNNSNNNTTNTQRRKSQKEDKKDNDEEKEKPNKKRRTEEEDEKRKNFLERNRLAALKCRQRKKQWLNNLQAKVEYLTNDNEQLQMQTNALREEIMNLKTLLLAHKDCPISQANGFPNLNSTTAPTNTNTSSTLLRGGGSSTTNNSNSNNHNHHHTNGNNNNTNTHVLPPPLPPSSSSQQQSVTTVPVSMAPIYTSQTYSAAAGGNNHGRAASSSTTSSNTLNMVMVPQQQVTAPPSSIVSSSSGVMQF
ncbi:hypothetical protein BJ944DRAFT_243104 [Cunninghamella echinulata]|nr:hypothetical protein BJ944DRAFT_243104 [Cunninghamella echinulata]